MQERLERIKEIYAREQAKPSLAVKLGDLPETYESITASWLTAVLARNVHGAEVVSFELGPKDEGTTNRRSIHLQWNDAGRQAGLAESLFCKATMGLANRLNMSFGGIDSEVNFYNVIRAKIPEFPCHEPAYASYSPESYNSIIMLRNIAGQVDFLNYKWDVTQEMVQQQLSALASLHAKFWGLRDSDATALMPFAKQFEDYVTLARIDLACAAGVDAAEDVIPPRLLARKSDLWPATVKSYQSNRQITLCHSDPHLSNWFKEKATGIMKAQDFQNCGPGDPFRDVIYCMTTALSVEKRRSWEADLVRHYLTQLKAKGGPQISEDEAWQSIRVQSFTALAFWTLTVCPGEGLPDYQPRDVAREYVRRLSHMVDDLQALDAIAKI